MDKEFELLKILTTCNKNMTINVEYFKNIDWDKFLNYSLRSKTICIIYNNIISHSLQNYLPTKIYKLMAVMFCGNEKHNQLITNETKAVTDVLKKHDIHCFEFKNHININVDFYKYQMPNDIDMITLMNNHNLIQEVLNSYGYKLRLINNQPNIQNAQHIYSAFFVKETIEKHYYPLKIDFTYGFDCLEDIDFQNLFNDYLNAQNLDKKNTLLFIYNILDFFSHISNYKNESVDIAHYFKIVRLCYQYNSFDDKSLKLLYRYIDKYKLTDIFNECIEYISDFNHNLIRFH